LINYGFLQRCLVLFDSFCFGLQLALLHEQKSTSGAYACRRSYRNVYCNIQVRLWFIYNSVFFNGILFRFRFRFRFRRRIAACTGNLHQSGIRNALVFSFFRKDTCHEVLF